MIGVGRLSAAAAVLLALAPCLRAPLRAQDRATELWWPAWVTAWSPRELATLRDQPLQRAPAGSDPLLFPPPVLGQFWSAGNPGALAFEVTGSYTQFSVGSADDAGAFMRPLDSRRSRVLQTAGLGWKPLGERAAAIGRVVVDLDDADLSFSHELRPYSTSPFVATDTTEPAGRRVRAGLEGALGWRLGGWGIGAALGYDAVDNRTQASKLPRLGRAADPAGTVGVVRAVPFLRLSFGAYARYRRNAERYSIIPLGTSGQAQPLEGLDAPAPQAIAIGEYYRRFDRRARAYGLTAGGRWLGASWVLFTVTERLSEMQTSDQTDHPAFDRWDADGRLVGAAAQRPFGRLVLVTARARYSHVSGDARRADLEGIVYRGREDRFEAAGELRYTSPDSLWIAAVSAAVNHVRRRQLDYLAELQAYVDMWEPGGAVEIGRVERGTAVSVGIAYGAHYAVTQVPDPAQRGPAYRTLIAPALDQEGARAGVAAATLTARRAISSAASLWARVHYERLAPSADPAAVINTSTRRTLFSAVIGILVGR